MKSFVPTLGLLVSATAVVGHATFQEIWSNGVDQVALGARLPLSNSPVQDVTSNDMRCNAGTTPVAGIVEVTAGQEMIVEMHQQPNQRECTTEAIGGAHYGPVLVYMSAVSDATTADGSSSWFKVAEDGYDVATKTWGTMNLNTNCGKQTFTVPADIAPGNYLVRAEAIALHSAGSSGGAQMYMTCFQVNVSGTGTAVPEGVLFPGAYSATDPGILINIYQTITEYIIPGPAVYTAGGASGAASSAAAPASSGSTSSVVSVSTSAAASSSVAVVRVSSASVSSSVAAISVSSAPASSSVAAIAIPTSTPVISATVIAVPTTLQTIVKSTTSSSAPVITSAAENYDSCE